MGRLPIVTTDNLNTDQKRLFEHIRSGKRGQRNGQTPAYTSGDGLPRPFNAWLFAPVPGDAAQRLGEILRFEGSLPPPLRELAILVVAAKWRCGYEWWAHERIGRSVGLNMDTMERIRKGDPPGLKDPKESIVYDFTRELIDTREVSDDIYNRATDTLGSAHVAELVILVGYYTMVSMTLNVFQVQVPNGERPPFDKIDDTR